jgi:hypothetical protein
MAVKAQTQLLEQEAELFGRYLVGQPPRALARRLYAERLSRQPVALTAADEKLLDFIHHHPRSLGLIDAGLAWRRPNSALRWRLFVLFAILESMPEHSAAFLPRQRPRPYLLVVAGRGVLASVKAIIGSLVIGAVG